MEVWSGSVRSLASVILLATVVGCGEQEAPSEPDPFAWETDFPIGPHGVGFRTAELTRPAATGSRALTLSVWYPAEGATAAETMTVGDYFDVVLAEDQLTETEGLSGGPAFAAAMTGVAGALTPERAREGLESPALAWPDAAPSGGPFPVVLWSSRHATVLAQAPLAEVLATHGFVVATVWSSDPPLAFLWEDRTEEEKLATIEAHTGDLEHALAALRDQSNVVDDRVTVLSWSYGGQTAARLQERDDGVRAVVAMDANVVPARPEESLDLRHPLVYLVGESTSGRGFERLDSLSAPWVAARFPELAHGSFNALEGYLPAVLEADTVFGWSQRGDVARDGYRGLVRVVTTAAQELTGDDPPSMAELATLLEAAAGEVSIEVLTSRD